MGDLERLGDTSEFGWTIMRLLDRAGWTITIQPGFAGDGSIVRVSRGDIELTAHGPVSEVAVDLLQRAVESMRPSETRA